jgi:hypothetical protein
MRPNRDRLAVLVDRDSEAYDMVVAAYGLSKASEETSSHAPGRSRRRCARDGCSARCHARLWRRIEQGVVVAGAWQSKRRERRAGGAGPLLAAQRGARLNVEVNLGMLKDAAYVALVGEEIARLTAAGARGHRRAREGRSGML